MKRTSISLGGLIAALAGILMLTGFGCCGVDRNPIIFVHGYAGSGAQFESQAMRFTSNGYPQSHLAVVEYDSFRLVIPDDLPALHARIDAKIAELQAATGRAQVDVMGHSLGTIVMHDYLSYPERAANIAHYVNIDGQTADSPPGDVPTLALWGGAVDRPEPPEIVGATNITIPDQEHVQVATSEESFFEMYLFLRDHAPRTTKILPQLRPALSGRVTIFPDNTGLDGATLEIWRVDRDTGERFCDNPGATFAIGPDGNFGPFQAWYGWNYEFVVIQEGVVNNHAFFEPFVRSDHLIRVNTAPLLEPFFQPNDDTVGLAVIRYKEYWGDRGAENDVLSIDGTDVINPTTAPSGKVGAASVAFFVLDDGSDGETNLTTIPFPFALLPFFTGADLFIPAEPPETLTIETVPRGDFGAARTVNIRRIPSTQARISVYLKDFEQ